MLLLFWVAIASASLDAPFEAVRSERFTYSGAPALADWKPLPFASALDVQYCASDFWFLAADGFVYTTRGQLVGPFPGAQKLSCDFAVSPTQVWRLSDGVSLTLLNTVVSPVNAVVEWKGSLLIAHEKGIVAVNIASGESKPFPIVSVGLDNSTVPVQSIAVAADGSLAFGTQWNLWRSFGPNNLLHYSRVPGVLDLFGPTALVASGQDLWIGTEQCASVQRSDFSLDRVCGAEGLPSGNATCAVSTSDGDVWFGTQRGVSRRRPDGSFRYYFGSRWLPTSDIQSHQTVVAMAANSTRVAVVTTGGVAILSIIQDKLADRMNLYEEQMSLHTQTSPERALPNNASLAGTSRFTSFGNTSSNTPFSNDNNGLWTSMYLLGEVFRWDLLKEPAAKKRAWSYLRGMETLVRASGIKGLPARSVAFYEKDPNKGGNDDNGIHWQKSPVYPGYWWKTDTSSDEITGHIAVYRVAYDLLCETAEEKKLVRDMALDIVLYIVQNDFMLIDWTGKPTTWGHWDPQTLNFNFSRWYDDRGLGALQILSWIVNVRTMADANEKVILDAAFRNLTDNYLYTLNMVNAAITEPNDRNYSDDELAMLNYFTILYAGANSSSIAAELHPFADASLKRYWRVTRNYRNPFYAFVARMLDPALVPDVFEDSLQEWPVEAINWPVDNSLRLDLHFVDALDEVNGMDSVTLIPYNENRLLRYNGDPFNIANGAANNNGMQGSDPGAPILAYWAQRWLASQ